MATLLAEPTPAVRALRENPVPILRRVLVHESLDAVTLSGTVHSWYLKQLAQEAVLPLLDGRRLVNDIAVVRPAPTHPASKHAL